MGDFNLQKLPPRGLQPLWEWKNRVLLEEYYIFNVAIPLEVEREQSYGGSKSYGVVQADEARLGQQEGAEEAGAGRRDHQLGRPGPRKPLVGEPQRFDRGDGSLGGRTLQKLHNSPRGPSEMARSNESRACATSLSILLVFILDFATGSGT